MWYVHSVEKYSTVEGTNYGCTNNVDESLNLLLGERSQV